MGSRPPSDDEPNVPVAQTPVANRIQCHCCSMSVEIVMIHSMHISQLLVAVTVGFPPVAEIMLMGISDSVGEPVKLVKDPQRKFELMGISDSVDEPVK